MATRVSRTSGIQDPARRAERAAAEVHRLTALASEYRAIRDEAVDVLLHEGWRPVDVAHLIGVTRAAMAQRWPAARQGHNGRPHAEGRGAD